MASPALAGSNPPAQSESFHASYDILVQDDGRWRRPTATDQLPEHWEWWSKDATALDANAKRIPTVAFHQAYWFPEQTEIDLTTTHVADGTLVREDSMAFGEVPRFHSDLGVSYGGLSNDLQVMVQRSEQTVNHTVFEQGALPCGWSTSTRPDGLLIEGDCRQWPNGTADAFDLKPSGDEQIGARLAQRFHGSGITVWMVDAFPVPVRIEATGIRRDLVGFRALSATEPSTGAQPPATQWETTSMQPWGLDETSFEGPFTPQDAYEAALWFPAAPPLGAFLLAHPTAIPYLVAGEASESGDRTIRAWSFVFADDETVWAGTVTQETRGAVSVIGVGGHIDDRRLFALPRLADVSQEVPTVKALAERWAAIAGGAATDANEWGYAIGCGDIACKTSRAEFVIGREHWTYPSQRPALTTEQVQGTISLARFTAEGRAVETLDSDFRTGRNSFIGQLERNPEPFRPGATAPRLTGLEIGGPALAGIAIAGALTLLVRFFPALMGLYARIRTDALPEHPTRSTIIDLVTQTPGINFSELLRTVGCSNGTLTHHLGLLEGGGHVVLVKQNGLACYYRTQQEASTDAHAWLRSTTARRILGVLAQQPRPTGLIHQLAGCSRSNAHRHLVQIERAGLIKREGRVADLTEKGHLAWQAVRGSAQD